MTAMFAQKAGVHGIALRHFGTALLIMIPGLTIVFGLVPDKWTGIFVVMGTAVAGAALLPSVRSRLQPTFLRIALGVIAGVALYGLSRLGMTLLSSIWPSSDAYARTLYGWKGDHSPLFLGITLVVIVLAEEVLWRGVVARYLMDRLGTLPGIALAAAIYAFAHAATLNPLLVLAALGCGIFWGILYAATDNLLAPTVSHLLWDILLLFLFPVVR